jgi:hypothetical protein
MCRSRLCLATESWPCFAAVARSEVEIVLIPSTAPGVREGVHHEIRRL